MKTIDNDGQLAPLGLPISTASSVCPPSAFVHHPPKSARCQGRKPQGIPPMPSGKPQSLAASSRGGSQWTVLGGVQVHTLLCHKALVPRTHSCLVPRATLGAGELPHQPCLTLSFLAQTLACRGLFGDNLLDYKCSMLWS